MVRCLSSETESHTNFEESAFRFLFFLCVLGLPNIWSEQLSEVKFQIRTFLGHFFEDFFSFFTFISNEKVILIESTKHL